MGDLLKGKKVLVTGGFRGNGKGIAEGFLREGAQVTVFDLMVGDNSAINYYQVDLQDKAALQAVFNTACEAAGGFDVLVNNAGISRSMAAESYTMQMWEQTLDINLTVPFLLSQMFARNRIEQDKPGSIINITSLGSQFGFPDNPGYCASKGGLRMLGKSLAYDWAKFGIRVNNVAPGYIRTDMTRKSWETPALRQERSQHIMLNRWGTPDDLAGVCVFLASELSAYITGQDIFVDGGWSSKGL